MKCLSLFPLSGSNSVFDWPIARLVDNFKPKEGDWHGSKTAINVQQNHDLRLSGNTFALREGSQAADHASSCLRDCSKRRRLRTTLGLCQKMFSTPAPCASCNQMVIARRKRCPLNAPLRRVMRVAGEVQKMT